MKIVRRFLAAPLALAMSALALGAVPQSAQAAPGPLVSNGDFTQDLADWRSGTAATRLSVVQTSRGGNAARVAADARGRVILTDHPNVYGVSAGTALEASVWVRADDRKATISLSVKEKNGDGREIKHQVAGTAASGWTQLRLPVTVTKANAYLDFAVRVDGLSVGDSILVDDAQLSPINKPPPDTTGTTETIGGQLTNGCSYSLRGIPACGAYAGGAYSSNGDPKGWESWLSKQIGVRRTYFSANQEKGAVEIAKRDAAENRISWMSFKAPYSWKEMAQGRGDSWARNLAAQLETVDGPVWVAVHHEPENDGGDIKQWTAMQARLAPIFRSGGSNVAYSIILMGWHQLYGQSQYSLENMWPKNTRVDIAGFDVYDEYGMTKRGEVVTSHKEFRKRYFEKFQDWSEEAGVRWGLAETGFSEASVRNSPSIMANTYDDMVATGGIALSYFNTNLNSTLDWRLNTTARKRAFGAIHGRSPTVR